MSEKHPLRKIARAKTILKGIQHNYTLRKIFDNLMFSGSRKTCCNKHIIRLLFTHIYLTFLFLVMPLLNSLLSISCRQKRKKKNLHDILRKMSPKMAKYK